MMTSVRAEEAETTREVIRSSTRKGTVRSKAASSTSELPSLVDVAKCTSDEVNA